MSLWFQLPDVFPTDGTTVWVRRVGSNYPFQAAYTAATDNFTTSTGHVIPWYLVTKWRDL